MFKQCLTCKRMIRTEWRFLDLGDKFLNYRVVPVHLQDLSASSLSQCPGSVRVVEHEFHGKEGMYETA